MYSENSLKKSFYSRLSSKNNKKHYAQVKHFFLSFFTYFILGGIGSIMKGCCGTGGGSSFPESVSSTF